MIELVNALSPDEIMMKWEEMVDEFYTNHSDFFLDPISVVKKKTTTFLSKNDASSIKFVLKINELQNQRYSSGMDAKMKEKILEIMKVSGVHLSS